MALSDARVRAQVPRVLVAAGAVGVLGLTLAFAGSPDATGASSSAADAWARQEIPNGDVTACVRVARTAGDLGVAFTEETATFSAGTTGDDVVNVGSSPVPPGDPALVWCGFDGDDTIGDNWGWAYGGPGNDGMGENWLVFRGGPGDDSVGPNGAYFDGGPGDDSAVANSGTFDGGPGDDSIVGDDLPPNSGMFNGGRGDDRVTWNTGTFNGGRGDDWVGVNEGTYDGGPGYDVVDENHGTCVNVEVGCSG